MNINVVTLLILITMNPKSLLFEYLQKDVEHPRWYFPNPNYNEHLIIIIRISSERFINIHVDTLPILITMNP